jgi:hypothetical protein
MSFLFKFLLPALLLVSPVIAEEVDPADKCDQAYDACLEKCEQSEDGSEQCYEACEKAYEKCLSLAQENQ